jgi:hypothetical protein
MNDGPHFDYGDESQSASLAGGRRSTRVFCDPPSTLSRYRSEDRKDAGNTFGLTGMWPRSLWATNHIPRKGLDQRATQNALGADHLTRKSVIHNSKTTWSLGSK